MDVSSKKYFSAIKESYRAEVKTVLDFWHQHGIDWEKDGIITFIYRDGTRWSDKKMAWFQGRGLYAFSMGYNDIMQNQTWLNAAKSIYRFLSAHLMIPDEPHGRMYYALDRDGNGLETAPDPYTEVFALMGLAEYYRASKEPQVLAQARKLYEDTILFYYQNPWYLMGEAADTAKCPMAWYMMFICSTQTLRRADEEYAERYTAFLTQLCEDMFRHYYDQNTGLFWEELYEETGHTCEAIWFIQAEAMYQKRQDWIDYTAAMAKKWFDLFYDPVRGGAPLYKNYNGLPDRLENWDIRRWWVQNEILLMLAFSYIATEDEQFLKWFKSVNEYVFAHFPDKEYGEWYGYLYPDGTPVMYIKGNDIKGPFHIPRQLIVVCDLLQAVGI